MIVAMASDPGTGGEDNDDTDGDEATFLFAQLRAFAAGDEYAGEHLLAWSGQPRTTARSLITVSALVDVCVAHMDAVSANSGQSRHAELAVGCLANVVLVGAGDGLDGPLLFSSLLSLTSATADPHVLAAAFRFFSNAIFSGPWGIDQLFLHAGALSSLLRMVVTNALDGDLLCAALVFASYVLCKEECAHLLHAVVHAGWDPLADTLEALGSNDADRDAFLEAAAGSAADGCSGLEWFLRVLLEVLTHHDTCSGIPCTMKEQAEALLRCPSAAAHPQPTADAAAAAAAAAAAPQPTDELARHCLDLLVSADLSPPLSVQDKVAAVSLLNSVVSAFNACRKADGRAKDAYVMYQTCVTRAPRATEALTELWVEVLLMRKVHVVEEVAVALAGVLGMVRHQRTTVADDVDVGWWPRAALVSFLELLLDPSTAAWVRKTKKGATDGDVAKAFPWTKYALSLFDDEERKKEDAASADVFKHIDDALALLQQ